MSHRGLLGFREDEEEERRPKLARPSELPEIGSRAAEKRTADKDESLILFVVSRSFPPDRRIRPITRGYGIGK